VALSFLGESDVSRILVLSAGGDGIGLALRLKAEGHDARVWIRETDLEDRGRGLIEHADEPTWGELVVADCTGLGALCDKLVEHGAKVVGGSLLADKLESDRDYATEVMQGCGIQQPESKSFTDWDSATAFIEASEDRLVFKPEGSLSGVVPSYCPSSNKELLEAIEHFKTLIGQSETIFTLQQFIEGTAVSTEAWFDGSKFLEPFNHTIERKHFLDGDLGPSGGCTGNLVWLADRTDPIVRDTVLKMEGFLREHAYIGAIDVNAVVNEEGVYALEFTPRFGYDAFPTYLQGLYEGDFGSLLWRMANKDAPKTMEVADRFAAGIRLSIPPWPTEKFKAEKGIPIRGITQDSLLTNFWPYDVQLEEDKLSTSGGVGIVGVMNGWGDTIEEAFGEAYRRVRRAKITDVQYRLDLEEVCTKDYKRLARVVSSVSS
jgi:phosphoribosylamine---glycine ligase